MKSLTFDELRRANTQRLPHFHGSHPTWSATDWACAMAGECGEACNLIKKRRRGEPIHTFDIGKELADAVIYAELLASHLGIDLGEAVRAKFNEVSERIGSAVRL